MIVLVTDANHENISFYSLGPCVFLEDDEFRFVILGLLAL